MNKQRVAIESREYVKQGFWIVTVCDQTGMKVGSISCEENCDLFHCANHDKQVVMCYNPNKKRF